MTDSFGRVINYLRLSLTDRCNLRCRYCMGEDGITLMNMADILTYEEILRLARIFASLGLTKIKVTGGEPLVRKGAVSLIRQLKQINGIEQVTLTTNGILLERDARQLAEAGLDGVNISIDRADAAGYSYITRGGDIQTVLRGIDSAFSAGITRVKTNTVLVRQLGCDTEEALCAVANLALQRQLDVRFIELMPVGGHSGLSPIPAEEAKLLLEKRFGRLSALAGYNPGNGPAAYYSIKGFRGHIGFIPAISTSFCDSCGRIRLTADGFLKLCLYYRDGINVKTLLRNGASDKDISDAITEAVKQKPERHRFSDNQDGEHVECRKMFSIGG